MSETKVELNRRVILHKRRKEKLRQQQKLIDVLSKDTTKIEADVVYIPLISKIDRSIITSMETTAWQTK